MAEPFQSQLPIKPDQIIDILIRRKWLIIIPLCITLTLGLYKTLTSAKTYKASTLILVQPQRVPTSYVQSIVTTSINERISTISQQILSRSNIEKIIDQFGLFEDQTQMYMEDKVASMRRKVQVRIERARHGAESFSISYTGSDPQRVMRIANTLASYFMDENLKVREAQAIGTSEFLESELEKTQKQLEEREQLLSAYRLKYLGELPDELDTNLRTLDRIHQQIAGKQVMLQQARNALSLLQTQIAQSKEMASQSFDDMFAFDEFEGEETFAASEEEQKLDSARQQYESLLLRYTEKHPDVLRLEKTIEKLEAAIARKQKEAAEAAAEPAAGTDTEGFPFETSGDITASEDTASEEMDNASPAMPNFAAMQQEAQLKQVQTEISKLESDIAKLEQRVQEYQQRIEDTPKREIELQALRRDYGNIRDLYNRLLNRKLEAELSLNMEKKQKGEQFRILDHARLPEKPISPNVKMLFLLSLAAGLGAGAGIVFLLEFFDNTIRSEDVIEKDLGLTLLARIPPLKKPGQKKKMMLEWTLFTCVSLYAIMFLGFFAILNWKGIDRTTNFIKNILTTMP
jgi:polysaccharide chain length determinant protein (PEP-CTERM system associated)